MNDIGYPNEEFLRIPVVSASTFTRIIIPPMDNSTGHRSTPVGSATPFPQAYAKLKEFAKNTIQHIIDRAEKHPNEECHWLLKELGPARLVAELRHQLEAFWLGQYPFVGETNGMDPLSWWKELEFHHHARVLAVSNILLVQDNKR